MSDTLLLAFNGIKRSGKDTAAKVVIEWAEARGLVAERRGFADLLKLSVARSLALATNMNDAIVMMDELKEVGDVLVQIPSLSIQHNITGREFLKYFGTEGHRDVFGEDFWVDALIPLDPNWPYNFARPIDYNNALLPDIAIITDCRFATEARRVKQLGGRVVNIYRPSVAEGDNHVSEQPLPPKLVDATIENNSSLEAFEVAVNSWMTAEYHVKFVKKENYQMSSRIKDR